MLCRNISPKVWPSAGVPLRTAAVVDKENQIKAPVNARFEHFVDRVCRLAIWRAEEGTLFRELQVMIVYFPYHP